MWSLKNIRYPTELVFVYTFKISSSILDVFQVLQKYVMVGCVYIKKKQIFIINKQLNFLGFFLLLGKSVCHWPLISIYIAAPGFRKNFVFFLLTFERESLCLFSIMVQLLSTEHYSWN